MPSANRASFTSLSIWMCFPCLPLNHWLDLPIQNRGSKQRLLCLVLDLFFSGCSGDLLLHGLSVVVRILFVVMWGLLIVEASLAVKHRLSGVISVIVAHRIHKLWCTWGLPRSGIEPVSPVLAGGFLIIGPPGMSLF